MINFSNVKEVKINNQDITQIDINGVNVWEKVKYYDGVPVFIDNATYIESGSHAAYEYKENSNYFLVFCDVGDVNKTITFGYGAKISYSTNIMRTFVNYPNETEKSKDYWTVTPGDRTVTMLGRYCIFSVTKSGAKYFSVYDNEGNYYIKGNEA